MPKRIKKPASEMLMPISVDVDLVRFEKNLLNLGFFSASDPRNEKQTSRRIEREIMRDGHRVKVVAELRASAQYGLPTTVDRDKFTAFLKILNEDRSPNGEVINPVKFSGYRMIQELGLTRHGGAYEDIAIWGKRMVDTTIDSKQVVFLASKKVYSDDTLHVFNRFRRVGTSNLDDSDALEGFEVELAEWFLANLNKRFVVPEDYNAYKKLKRPISKGIFGFLHLAFHASAGRPVEKDYAVLCNELGVKAYPYLSKIKSTLGVSLDELVQINYLSKWEVHSMVTKNGYKIVMTAGSELVKFLSRNSNERKLQADGIFDERPLDDVGVAAVTALTNQGVTPEKALVLTRTFGADRILDIVDYQEQQIYSAQGKIKNPAGLIIFSLENSLPIPVGFITSRRRRDMEAANKVEQQRKERQWNLEQAYVKWVEDLVEEQLCARYSTSELEAKINEIVSHRTKTDDLFKRVNSEQKRHLAGRLIRKEIKGELVYAAFDEWVAGNNQGLLF
jgi:hypothetical protein